MTERNIVEVEKGRHPLQELCVDSFVSRSLVQASVIKADLLDGHHQVPNDTCVIGGRGTLVRDETTDDDAAPEDTSAIDDPDAKSVLIVTGA